MDFWGPILSLGGFKKLSFGGIQKMDFWGPILGGFPVELPQKILGEKIAFAAQQLCTKIRF